MHIRIVADDDERALTDLKAWLGRDPGTRTLSVEPVTGTGPTLSALEALDIILGRAVDIASFAVAYATWRSTRGNRAAEGARRLVHGEQSMDIGHLTAEELTERIRGLADVSGEDEENHSDEDHRLS